MPMIMQAPGGRGDFEATEGDFNGAPVQPAMTIDGPKVPAAPPDVMVKALVSIFPAAMIVLVRPWPTLSTEIFWG